MSSSVQQIEVSPVRDMRTDDSTLTVVLQDGRSIVTPLAWHPRLAYGTAQERANWRTIAGGEGIHWPDLDEDISVEGLIAGRRSGESASSLDRWRRVQDALRATPRDQRELRREVLQSGPLPASEIVSRALADVEAYEIAPTGWRVGVATDPFGQLSALQYTADDACRIFRAISAQQAKQAAHELVSRGIELSVDEPVADDAAYLFVCAKR